MTEKDPFNEKEVVKWFPDQITRQLIVIRGRSGLVYEDLDEGLVANQAKFGRGTNDYVAMVQVHESSKMGLGEHALGIHEEVRRKCAVIMDGQEVEFVEQSPRVRNIWVGANVKLLTSDEASKTHYGGQTALYWATIRGRVPEMVVCASNGYYYPATINDVILKT